MKRLRWYDFIWVNLFWLGLNIRNYSVGNLIMPYLVDLFAPSEIKNTALGALRTGGLLVAMLVQPAVGLLSDRSTSRFGRRRPYLLAGVILDLIFIAGVIFAWDYTSLFIAVMLFQFSSNVSHGPLQGLIPDLVPEAQRGVASAVKSIFELLPLILVGLTTAKVVGMGRLDLAALIVAGSLLVILLMTLALVKEQPLTEKPDAPLKPALVRVLGMLGGIAAGGAAGVLGGGLVGGAAGLLTNPFAGSTAAWGVGVGVGGAVAMVIAVLVGVWAGTFATLGADFRKYPSFNWWVINRLFFLAAITSLQSYAPFFLMYAFQINREAGVEMTGNLITMVGIFTLVSALPGGWLSDRIGHKRIVAASGILAVVGTILILGSIWVPDLAIIQVAGAILGLATGLFMTGNWALGTALAPKAEAGRFLGISNLAGAGAGMIGAGIGGPVADFLNSITPGLGYFAIFTSFALLFLLSAVSLVKVRC